MLSPAAARHSRLCALACPDAAELYKARARSWLAEPRAEHSLSRSQSPPLNRVSAINCIS
jgi:hypothetical protein